MKMYESPIDISYSDMILKTMDEMSKKWNQESDNHVMACVNQFVKVDKDELIRALEYDRKQYEKGYEDGKRDAMKWISVKERLPERGRYVLIANNYRDREIGFVDGDGIWWVRLNGICDGEVTHWMPLPEPPEVEG